MEGGNKNLSQWDVRTCNNHGYSNQNAFYGNSYSFQTAATGFNSASDDILTPNTLHSIEQSLQMQQTMTSSGYTTTTVAPPVHIKQEFVSADDSSQDPDWVPGYQAKRPKMDNKIPLTVHMEENYAVSSSGRRTGPRPRKPIVEVTISRDCY